MKQFRFIIALTLSVSILLSCCACSKKQVTTEEKPYEKLVEKISTVNSGTVEENENYALIWDDTYKCIQLLEKSTGNLWSTTPLKEDGSYAEDINSIYSPINIEYIKRSAYRTIEISGKSGAVEKGKVSAEKIENGIQATFMFDELSIAIPIQFVLSSDGLDVSVDLEKIVENPNNDSRIFKISLMPYFSCVRNTAENYLFVPSGSGALMYADERGDGSVREFSGKIYGEDPVQEKNESYTNETDIRLPVFGVKNSNATLCAVVENSAEKCEISAKAGDSSVGYSYVYPAFQVRGYNGTVLDYGGTTGKKLVNYYSDERISSGKLSVSYKTNISSDEGYIFMANTYREYLEEKYSLQKNSQNNLISLKFYGGIQTKEHIFGIPYYTVKALTTFTDILNIANDLKSAVDSFDLQLVGFGESGIDTGELAGNFTYSDAVGNKKSLSTLQNYCADNNVDLHFDYDLLYFSESGNGFSTSSDNSHTANGYPAEIYRYSPATSDKMDEYGIMSILSRANLSDAVDKLITSSKKMGLTAVSVSSLSNTAYSDFSNEKYQNCSGMGEQVSKHMVAIKENGLKVAVSDANDYAASVADKIYDAPSNSDTSDAFDCEVPFYQIVYKGYTSFSMTSINTASNTKKQILKSIETGSPLQFSLIADYSADYAFYNHDNLQLMLYDNNKEIINSTLADCGDFLNKVKNQGIKEHTLINGNVRKTVFNDGTTVYVNYGSNEYKAENLIVNAMSFKVVE